MSSLHNLKPDRMLKAFEKYEGIVKKPVGKGRAFTVEEFLRLHK